LPYSPPPLINFAFKVCQRFELTLVHNNNNCGRKHVPWRKNSQSSFFLQIVGVVIHIQNYQPWIFVLTMEKRIVSTQLCLTPPPLSSNENFHTKFHYYPNPHYNSFTYTLKTYNCFSFWVPKTIITMVELPSRYKQLEPHYGCILPLVGVHCLSWNPILSKP
jgi:hypothetical protein